MESIYLAEFELSLYKLDTAFEMMINSDIINYDIYTEKSSNTPSKIKALILKYFIICDTYLNNVLKLFELYKQKRDVQKNIKIMERVIKKNPEIAKQKIRYRIYDNWKDIIDFETSITNNLAYRIENLDDEYINSIIDAYYKDIDTESYDSPEVTIEEALKDTIDVIKDIDNAIAKQKKILKTTSSKLSKSKNLTAKHVSLIKKLLLSVQKSIQRLTFKSSIRLDYLYNEIHKAVEKTITDESKEYTIRKYARDSTAEKNADHIGTVRVLDYDIELYRTDKYIMSEYSKGNCVYFDRDFINLPKSHQVAILYHEYGHIVNGHTMTNDRKYRNEYKLSKQLKKSIKKYDKMVAKSKFEDIVEVNDDSLLLYILVELDADRFAAKMVGKDVIKKALMTDYRKLTKTVNMSDLEKEYHMFIGNTRTSMI